MVQPPRLPSRICVDRVHAFGVRFESNPALAIAIIDNFTRSTEYACISFDEDCLAEAIQDVYAHSLPLTLQMQVMCCDLLK